MLKFKDLIAMQDNDGMTLKGHKPIEYKSGWQVATEGVETRNSKMAIHYIKMYGGNCGIWKSNGTYYIDKSHRVNTKREALQVGRACNQQSILKWSNKSLVWC